MAFYFGVVPVPQKNKLHIANLFFSLLNVSCPIIICERSHSLYTREAFFLCRYHGSFVE